MTADDNEVVLMINEPNSCTFGLKNSFKTKKIRKEKRRKKNKETFLNTMKIKSFPKGLNDVYIVHVCDAFRSIRRENGRL